MAGRLFNSQFNIHCRANERVDLAWEGRVDTHLLECAAIADDGADNAEPPRTRIALWPLMVLKMSLAFGVKAAFCFS
eukprot:8180234-Pyramimonas_sp.AAC.1